MSIRWMTAIQRTFLIMPIRKKEKTYLNTLKNKQRIRTKVHIKMNRNKMNIHLFRQSQDLSSVNSQCQIMDAQLQLHPKILNRKYGWRRKRRKTS